MLTDQEHMDRGYQAEQAMPYITTVVEQAKEIMLDRMMNLKPNQTELFSIYSAQRMCLDDIVMLVQGDINNGQIVIDRLQGNPQPPGGIL